MRNLAVAWALKEAVYQTVNGVVYQALHQAVCGDVGRRGAVYRAVYWDLDRAVDRAVNSALDRAVDRAVNSAVHLAVYGALSVAPPHPGLANYLGSVT